MEHNCGNAAYFKKHHFRAGLECPTKLFYKAKGYPEDRAALPFINHSFYNKQLLKSLVRSPYSSGRFIEGDSIEESAMLTKEYLSVTNRVLFDAIFIHRQMMARLPLVVREGQQLTVFEIQTKVFSSQKHRLLNSQGEIHSKWRGYLLDFAYQLYVIRQVFPRLSIQPLLVFPDKSGYAQTDALPAMLKPFEKRAVASAVPASNQQLLAKLEVGDSIAKIWDDPNFAGSYLPKPTFSESVTYLRDVYLGESKVKPEIGYKCRNCEFNLGEDQKSEGARSGFDECWQPVQPEAASGNTRHVFNLIGPGNRQLIEQGVFYQRNINNSNMHSAASIAEGEGRITEKMRRALQVHKTAEEEVPGEIMRTPLLKELESWVYPLHFLDFEAGNYAVPVRAGRPPYHLVVFQFSCHTLRKDGSWKHYEWLDDLENDYANYELVRRLRQVPDLNEGTIVQYSNFERNALKVIRRELSEEPGRVPGSRELIQWIEDILRRNDSNHPHPPYLADLSRQVKHFYYNSEMENSLSIKDVLQSVMTQSEYLAGRYSKPYSSQNFDNIIWWQPDGHGQAKSPYSILKETGDDAVQRGTEAMYLYGKLISGGMGEKEKAACRKSLLRYCELDTLAMLMIFEHWKQKMNQLY